MNYGTLMDNMRNVTVIINGQAYDLMDLGEQKLSSSHLRSDICIHHCDLVKECGRFLYDAAVPCLLGLGDDKNGGTGFYFQLRGKLKNNKRSLYTKKK